MKINLQRLLNGYGLLSKHRLLVSGALLLVAAAGVALFTWSGSRAQADAAKAAMGPVPASVATVEERDTAVWDEFSGRLEAVEQVEVRSRVAGAIKEVRFREGAMVQKDDILVVIDPDLYAADVARAEAQVAAAQSKLVFTKADYERGQQLTGSQTISLRDQDNRINAYREADANLKAAQAMLKTAQLNLGYTEVRAPISGRVGKREITDGNLIAAGPGSPLLTTIVSTSPIYASFNADEQVVLRALEALGNDAAAAKTGRIPVKMGTSTSDGTPYEGQMQLIDNQVDSRSGTVRVRAVFDNADGRLIPGQFVRLLMGQPRTARAMTISERAVGTDQNKKFVMVVSDDNKAEYREIGLGASVDGQRVVSSGLKVGERIVVKGLQRVRPGATIAPQTVAMDAN
ncbi:MAG: efflux RND transporter periplasmic adaptor subunit [Xanthobacteraceae bacterium]|nr:efflux RND transporter periplasmic adaptor subunit [Xanthobacteraceae bacterium]